MQKKYDGPAQVYDLIYKDRVDDVLFYKELVSELKPKKVLEIGAGTGRVLLPCAEANPECHFTAIDERTADLSILHDFSILRGLKNIETIEGNFLERGIKGKFNLISAPFRVLQHCLSPKAFIEFCGAVRALIDHDGCFVFDIFDPNDELLKKRGLIVKETIVDEAGSVLKRGIFVNKRNRKAQLQFIEERYNVKYPDGTSGKFTREYYTRWHYEREVREFLSKSGLCIENVYGTFKKEPPGTSPLGELIFKCRI